MKPTRLLRVPIIFVILLRELSKYCYYDYSDTEAGGALRPCRIRVVEKEG